MADDFQDGELSRELEQQVPVPVADARAPSPSLLLLYDRPFEVLAYSLLRAESSETDRHDHVRLLQEGPDRGRDLLLYRDGKLVGIVQCKRKAKVLGLEEILTELLRFSLYAAREPSLLPAGEELRYELWTAFELSEKAVDLFSDSTVARRTLSKLDTDRLKRARKGRSSLAEPDDPEAAEIENQLALRIASRLKIRHVPPMEIWLRLNEKPEIRRLFFRLPEDVLRRAEVDEIDQLIGRYREAIVAELGKTPASADPYIPREGVDEAFGDFMTDACSAFVLIGGSGQGKTSWAASLLRSPPPLWSVDVVRAEDIGTDDRNLVDTLAGLLGTGRAGSVPMTDLLQSVWSWMEADNRLVVVDGLDRAAESTRERIPGWLRRSGRAAGDLSIRLVLTSRREAWRTIADQLGWPDAGPGGRPGAIATHELGPPSAAEATALYAAYGVSTADLRGKPLASPSLIKLFSQLKKGDREGVVTRADLLEAHMAAVERELARKPAAGTVGAALLLDRIGRLLLTASDGWMPLQALAETDALSAAVEQLVADDHARRRGTEIRLDSDDMIEFLMGRVLDPETAAQMLAGTRDDPLFVGGVAMMVARLERKDAANDALRRLLKGARPGMTPQLDAVARSLLEVRNPEKLLDRARDTVRLWNEPNLFLQLSGLGALLDEIALPPAQRFSLMRPLARFEDADDWRDKYWFNPDLGGRMPTALTRAAERAVREDPAQIVPELLEMLDETEPSIQSMASFLIREAAAAHPAATLSASWPLVGRGKSRAFDLASSSVPGPAIGFLSSLQADKTELTEIVERLSHLAHSQPFERRPAPPEPDEVVQAVAKLLARNVGTRLEVKLLTASLAYRADEALRARLVSAWSQVEDEDYWTAMSVAGADRERLLQQLLRGKDREHDRSYILSRMSPAALSGTQMYQILGLMGDLLLESEENAVPVADAVEMMLYAIPPGDDPGGELLRLALAVAESENDRARSKIIYYAGSPCRGESRRGEIRRRETLLAALIDNESGANLHQLVWKLGESADERPDPVEHGLNLIAGHGERAVFESIDRLAFIPYMAAYGDDLRSALTEDGD